MIDVSYAFRKAIADTRIDYVVSAAAILTDSTVLTFQTGDVWMGGFVREDSVSPQGTFHVGGAVIGQATFTLNNLDGHLDQYDFVGADIEVSVGFVIEGLVERIEKITGTVAASKVGSGIVTLTIYDYMSKFDTPYITNLDFTNGQTLLAIVNDACTKCGVTPGYNNSFPNDDFVVANKPNGESVTFREVIMWAAQIAGCFAKCTPDGKLIFDWYKQDFLTEKMEELRDLPFDPAVFYQPGYQWFELEGLPDSFDITRQQLLFYYQNGRFYVEPTNTSSDFTRSELVLIDQTDESFYIDPSDTATTISEGEAILIGKDGRFYVGIDPTRIHYGIRFIFSTFAHDVSLDDVVITGVKVSMEDTNIENAGAVSEYMSGTDGYVVGISGNQLISASQAQSVADYLAGQLVGFTFRRASVQHTPDPALEAGDVAILFYKEKMYPMIVSSTTFDLSGHQSTESSAEEPARNQATRVTPTTKNFVKAKEMVRQERTARQAAYDDLERAIQSHSGLYQTIEAVPGGGYIYYLHDQPTRAASSIIWKMTAEAFAVSTDGGTTWNGGMTAEGNAILNRLSAVTIDVDDLTVTGTIHDAANKNSWDLANGDFNMTDGEITLDGTSRVGTDIRSVLNENGLTLGQRINGGFFPKMYYQDFIRGEYNSSDHDDYLLTINPAGQIAMLGVPGTSQGYPRFFASGYSLRMALSENADTFFADNSTGITEIRTLRLNGLSDTVNKCLSENYYTNKVSGISLYAIKRGKTVWLYARGTTTEQLSTASGYVNLGTLPADMIPACVSLSPAVQDVCYTEMGQTYKGQFSVTAAGVVRIGYTREYTASANSDIASGAILYIQRCYVTY